MPRGSISAGVDAPASTGGNPVGDLDPAVRRGEDVGRHAAALEDLGPEPLRRIDATDRCEVLRCVLAGHGGDLGRLGGGGVVLPEPGVGGEVVLPSRDRARARRCARRPASVWSRWCRRRCRRPGRSARPTRLNAVVIDSRKPQRGSRPGAAGPGADRRGRAGCRGRPRDSQQTPVPRRMPSAQSATTARTELVPKSTPMVHGTLNPPAPDSRCRARRGPCRALRGRRGRPAGRTAAPP